MRRSEIEKKLLQCMHEKTEPDTEERGREAVMLAARQAYRTASGKKRISFWQFMTSQARFLGWKIWSMQAASLAVMYFLIYTVCAGDIGYLWGRYLPVLLCFGSVLLLFPTLPILARSRRYQMAETEQVSRFSSNRLLIARLVMIGAGDFLMLTLLFFLTVGGMGGNPGVAVLYLLVPFLILGSIYITIAAHVQIKYVLITCLAAGMGAVVILLLMYYFYYGFYEQSFRAGWALVCAGAVLWDVIQLNKVERRETAVDTWI